MSLTQDRVVRACQRCRQQKLKCDVNRPCTLCTRARTDCVSVAPNIWKHVDQKRELRRRHVRREQPRTAVSNDLQQPTVPSSDTGLEIHEPLPSNDQVGLNQGLIPPVETLTRPTNSSSTVALIDEAFQYHDSTRPPDLSTITFRQDRNGQTPSANCNTTNRPVNDGNRRRPSRRRGLASTKLARSALTELTGLMPPAEPATILLDTYFDRVHWFLLLFHQDDFRDAFKRLLSGVTGNSAHQSLGFLSTALAVCAIGLHYVGSYRAQLLGRFNISPDILKEQILETLGRRLLDVIALGSLEAVQTCVLLGTYYLYHGEPDLAWPICGCGLRIAQALNLHRKAEPSPLLSEVQSEQFQRVNEARKRCWWAIYEIETFCSMLYGLPLSISDEDCDVEYLLSDSGPNTTLLAYKPLMSRLSVIVRSALSRLYNVKPSSYNDKAVVSNQVDRLYLAARDIADLDNQLRTWFDQLPKELQPPNSSQSILGMYSAEELEYTLGAAGPRFEKVIFQLQAFSLRLAYENARIMIHRPLLGYKRHTTSTLEGHNSQTLQASNIDQDSARVCYDAALQISLLGSLPIFRLACDTYAVSFVVTNLLTAGITLGILASADPLSQASHESKLGIHRIMQMQSLAKPKSVVAGQGYEILKKLTTLLLEKELNTMLSPAKQSSTLSKPLYSSAIADDNDIGIVDLRRREAEDLQDAISQRIPPTTAEDVSSTLQLDDTVGQISDQFRHIHEDHDIMQAILNFDHLTQPTYDQLNQDPDNSHNDLEPFFDSNFIDQDQGWIWGFDVLNQNV